MDPQQLHPFDLHRLLIGHNPTWFLLEVGYRAVVTYVILWGAMRLMGKRVAGQMSALELTIVVTLGAAIGVPLQAPERGMVGAVVILLVAIVYQRGLNFWAFKSRKAELTLQGDVSTIVSDGCLDLPAMRAAVLSRERLFSALRQAGARAPGPSEAGVPRGRRPLQHLQARRPPGRPVPVPRDRHRLVRAAQGRERPLRLPKLRQSGREPRRRARRLPPLQSPCVVAGRELDRHGRLAAARSRRRRQATRAGERQPWVKRRPAAAA